MKQLKTYGPDVRKAGRAFGKWVYSGDRVAKIFLQLTQLTVDLARELRTDSTRGSRGRYKRFTITAGYLVKINPMLERIVRKYPALPQLVVSPDRDDAPTLMDMPPHSRILSYKSSSRENARRDDLLIAETRAAYNGMDQYQLLAKHCAFEAFRRCALPTCGKYFFPLRPETLYCSKGCWREHYMEDPQRKEKNAAEKRVNYYANKVLDLAKLAALNAVHKKKYDQAKKALKSAKAELAALRIGQQ